MRTIVFFNLAVMPYHVAVIRAIIKKGFKCVVYWWGKSPKTSYRAPEIEGLTLINRFNFKNVSSLYNDATKWDPTCIVCCGWKDNGYNKACSMFKHAGIPTLAMSDTQWRGGRQWINRILAPIRHKHYFDYIWAAGLLQYEYARKLGYDHSHILLNCFSCDIDTFIKTPLEYKTNLYPKRFLFVGRFVKVKGIDTLIEAWNNIYDKKGWTLELIGDGPLKEEFCYLNKSNSIIIKDFMSQDALSKEAANAGCFILPSHFEPWALVIQEFAAAGLPIICTKQCGASKHFVLNGYNGYVIEAKQVKELISAMTKIMNSTMDELFIMAKHSRNLSLQVTPDFVASTLLSIIN